MTALAVRWRWRVFWIVFLAVASWFVIDDVTPIAREYLKPGFVPTLRQVSASLHFLLALPILLFAPLQFSTALRMRQPRLHRWLGTVFLASSILAALIAIHLGVTIRFTGSRVPLVLFGLLWLCFSIAAWQTARRRDIVAHRKFVVRSIGLALAFVWVRALGVWEDQLFGFMKVELRGTTREWLSFVLPLVVIETWFTWWPAAQRSFRPLGDRPVID